MACPWPLKSTSWAPVYAALNGQTQGFVVYDFHTGDNTTGGNWTDDPDYDGGLTVTGFTDENADFQSYMVGWDRAAIGLPGNRTAGTHRVSRKQGRTASRGKIADVEKPSFLTIFAVTTTTRVEVFGDATGLSADGKTYRLVPPTELPGSCGRGGAFLAPSAITSTGPGEALNFT